MRVPMRGTQATPQESRLGLGQALENQTVLGFLLVLPLLLVMLGLLLYPLVNAFWLSLQDKVLGQAGRFVGLANYRELLFKDRDFLVVVRNSLVFTVGSVAVKLILGMGMALILNERIRFRNLFRGWLLLPWVTPAFVSALTARWMFDATAGIINYVLLQLHLIRLPIAWLGNGRMALFAVTATSIWRGFPFFGVTLLAAMQTLSTELYEAAEVDGASSRQKFWHITIPGIRTVMGIVVMLSLIWTVNDFATVYLLTGGGPGNATHIFPTYAYQMGFMASRFGYAVAVSMILTPALLALILVLSPLILRGEGE